MCIKKLGAFIVFIGILFSCQKTDISFATSPIIPMPLKVEFTKGEFVLDKQVGIQFDDQFKVSGNFLKAFIEKGNSLIFNKESSKNILFLYDDTIESNEGYSLNIDIDQIEIRAKTDQGAFYAVQSLRQLLPASFENGTFVQDNFVIQCQRIEDQPQFEYRGMHLDVGRHMYSIEFIKKYIDALAMLKMNTFHWHLTEDQGWRLEIKKYPKLNEVAAFRKETLIGHYSDQPHQFDGKIYGGFYTQEQIKALVKYAQERHITIIPEIEMPGHSQAAIAAYPELGCSGETVEVATKWGVFEEIYCTKDETFNFIEDVLDEVLELFPSEYIHIGGDEAPKTRWKACEKCQTRIKTEGLKDEHELQNYFISRIEKYLNSKGRQIIGWDEILEGGLAPNATVMSWRGLEGAVEAAKQHHHVIMTPTSHCYFDYYQSENDGEPLAIGGFLPLEKVYGFDPIPTDLTKEESGYVLGAQGNVWTEYLQTEDQVEYMVFPRILAMSEVVWTPDEKKIYFDFISRVENFNERFEALNINYANHLYEVTGELNTNNNMSNFKLQTLTKDKDIRFTIDGSEPNMDATLYSDPIPIESSLTIKAAVFNDDKKFGRTFTQAIYYHKAVGKGITMNVTPSNAYSGSGKNGLINGISGSDSRFGDKEWLGFWGDDLEIIIDLGKETEINSIETRFHNGKSQWIYAPKYVEFGFDAHGIDSKSEIPVVEDNIVNIKILPEIKTRFIHLRIPNYGVIPDGKQGAGNKAWTFIDEIIVN